MLNITICEDEPTIRNQITNLVQEWGKLCNLDIKISTFENAESFLFNYEDDKNVDILLLDIQMGSMNGMALARKLRETNTKVQIIFITGISDYVTEGYDVSAVHYLLKPVRPEKLHIALDKAASNLSVSQRTISIDTDDGIFLITVNDIIYTEAFDHTLTIYLKEEKINCKMPLYKLEELLSDSKFVKIHRSYLVNLAYVKRITRSEVILDSGQTLPLSRRLYKDVNSALLKYVTGNQV